MRLLLRYSIFAVLGGLVLGLLLRAVGARKRFGTLCLVALLPLLGHAGYLAYMVVGADAELSSTWPFAALILADLVVAVVLVRRWHRTQMLWAALLPAAAGLVYAAVASLMLSFTLGPADVVPSAFAAAVYALITLTLVAMLLAFVPGEPRVDPSFWTSDR